jgi:hypothetical protein
MTSNRKAASGGFLCTVKAHTDRAIRTDQSQKSPTRARTTF